MNRKAALQMSLQSIMVFILAFIVMGILIAVINAIFDPVREGVEALTITEIETGTTWGREPSRLESVVIGTQTVTLRPLQTRTVDVGVYNRLQHTLVGDEDGNRTLQFEILRCRDFDGELVHDNLPALAATREILEGQDIRPGEVRKYSAQIRDEGLDPGERYTCTIAVNYHVEVPNVADNPIDVDLGADQKIRIGAAEFVLHIE